MTGLPGDYHVHTTFSDGDGTVAECVARAVDLGLGEIGIADHFSPSERTLWESGGLSDDQLPGYAAAVRKAGSGRDDIRVLLALEVDYYPEHEDWARSLCAARSFDYLIGAVHEVDGFEFDHPSLRADARWDDADALLTRYYELAAAAAASGAFDVIAHLDYIGLWGHRASAVVDPVIDAALDAVAASGAALELNTDRVSDPVGLMYPSPDILRRACHRGIRLVISSDAHEVAHVGRLWDEAIRMARAAGYTETLRLSDRALVPLP